MNLDEMSISKIMTYMNQEDKTVPYTVEKAFPQIEPVITKVVETIQNGGKVVYMGSGTSGRLGVLDASECPPTFGVSPNLFTGLIAGGDTAIRNAVENAEDSQESGAKDASQTLTEGDLLIAVAASGQTPYVIGGVKQAKKMDVPTAGVVCSDNSTISQLVDFPIELIVGEEIVQGSTRLKAGTAQKLVLNMISTISMIKSGKVYQNYMVDVQASNEKLRNRTISIIQDIADVDEKTAKTALVKCNNNLKAATLVSKFQIEPNKAFEILEAASNNLRRAMAILNEQ